MDILKQTYPSLMFCVVNYLEREFASHYDLTQNTGWTKLHDLVAEVDIALSTADPAHEFPNQALHVSQMRDAQSLAKDLLGNHIHVNFLWRLEWMIVHWSQQQSIRFSDLTLP